MRIVIDLSYCHLVKIDQEILPFHVKYTLPLCPLDPPVLQPILLFICNRLPEGILVVKSQIRGDILCKVPQRIPDLQQRYLGF